MSFLDTLIDKPAVVLDIGHAYTKCGFAGETGPHSIVPTKLFGNLITSNLNLSKSINIYDYKKLAVTKKSSSEQNLQKFDLDKDEAVLRELLLDFLYRVYYKILNVNSRERKVVIVESLLTPDSFRKVLSEVLSKNFQAISVTFISSHMASLFALGSTVGLVLDCGYSDCQLVPIAESYPIIGLCDYVHLGSKRIHDEIRKLLVEYAEVTLANGERVKFRDVQPAIELSEEILEDIKIRCCFVTTLQRSRFFNDELMSIFINKKKESPNMKFEDFKVDLNDVKAFKFAPECDYDLVGNNMLLHVPGYVREMSTEILFLDSLDENQTIPNLVLDTLIKCPVDLKKPLSENILLMGGTFLLNGFKHRLVSELNHLLNDENLVYSKLLNKNLKFKFHQPPSIDNYTAWLGGAIFGSLDSTIEPLSI